jgi:kinetochore protein Nuf2
LKSQLTEKNSILAEKVNSIRLHRAEQEPQVQELRALNSTLASDLKELRRLQQAISSDIEQFKKEKLDLDDKLVS